MPKGSRKKPKREDTAQAAVRVMETMAEHSEAADAEPVITDEMRAAAAAFGRIGGKIGGPSRARRLSADERKQIAAAGAAARWGKARRKPE